jgi:hypothetical protein
MRDEAILYVIETRPGEDPVAKVVREEEGVEDRQTWGSGESALVLSDRTYRLSPDLMRIDEKDRHWPPTAHDVPGRERPAFVAGDVVHAAGVYGIPDGPDDESIAIRLMEPLVVLGNTADPEVAISMAKELDSRLREEAAASGHFHLDLRLRCEGHLEFTARWIREKKRPNDVLFAAWRSTDWRDQPTISSCILASRGAYMFFVGGTTCEDAGFDPPDEPGLWVLLDGKPWTGTDWETGLPDDGGLDGEVERITLEEAQARFGIGPDEIREALSKYVEEEPEAGILEAVFGMSGAGRPLKQERAG